MRVDETRKSLKETMKKQRDSGGEGDPKAWGAEAGSVSTRGAVGPAAFCLVAASPVTL